MSASLTTLSNILGWTYLLAWSLSFYGQVYSSYKCQSVEGLNLNFQLLNLSGFAFYSFYNSAGYYWHSAATGEVTIQDLIFSYHALAVVIFQWAQCFYYKRGKNRLHQWCYILNIGMWIFLVCYYVMMTYQFPDANKSASPIAMAGYLKLFISFIKYMPQVYWNWARQSTYGWSIFNILLDFTGGSFSMLQIVIDSANGQSGSTFAGGLNITKFCLSLFSMFFDLIFMFQHYVLYKGSHINEGNTETILRSKNQEEQDLQEIE